MPGSPQVERGRAAGKALQGDLKTTQLGPIAVSAPRQCHGSSPTPMGTQGAVPGRCSGPSPAPLQLVALVAQCHRAPRGANLILLASERPKHLWDHPSSACTRQPALSSSPFFRGTGSAGPPEPSGHGSRKRQRSPEDRVEASTMPKRLLELIQALRISLNTH